MRHSRAQQRLLRLLERAVDDTGIVTVEFGYSATEYDYRRADVVYVPKERWDAIGPEDHFRGAPDLVIEVLSPSNTASEMREKRKLCLANGSVEFWVVDPVQRDIEVSTPDGRSIIYGSGQQIPLFFASVSSIPVDAIFA